MDGDTRVKGEALPEGWCRDASGAIRREKIPSMLRRMLGWDYRQRAIYQITITLEDRAGRALGRLEVKCPGGWAPIEVAKDLGLQPEAIEARVALSELGEAVAQCWAAIPRFYPQAEPLGLQLMPDHLHGILFVKEPLACHLGQVVKGFKVGCNKAARVLYSATLSPSTERATLSPSTERAPLSPSTERAPLSPSTPFKNGHGLFAEGFQDTVLLHEGQLANMKRYLADNPRRLAIKKLFPDLFKVVSELAIPLKISMGASGAAQLAKGHFAALGNRFLLDRQLVQIQVSRRDFKYRREPKPGGGMKIARDAQGEPLVDFASQSYTEKKAALFAAAKHGAVLISPCVSDGERQIAREALQAQLPLITLQNKGFSPLQKPSGRYFDACADGRLLMLAPAAWPYETGEKAMTRFDATAMNRLCQWIVGENAAEINYHGMQPVNIDALAKSAAKVEEVSK